VLGYYGDALPTWALVALAPVVLAIVVYRHRHSDRS
jgi:hypothetical protein